MAGDWIKIEHITPDKPEIHQIAEHLGIDSDAVVGKLMRFWIWADQQIVSGNAICVTKVFIDRITYAPGFTDALLKVGWLHGHDGMFVIPHFDRHNGKTAKKRAETNRRVARYREQCNAGSVTTTLPKALPEKRREENKEERESVRETHLSEQARQVVETYPRREKIADALTIALGALRDGENFEEMLAGTRACAAVIRSLPSAEKNRYVPSAESFFRNKRWKDDPATLKRQGNPSSGSGQGPMSPEEAAKLLGRRAYPTTET